MPRMTFKSPALFPSSLEPGRFYRTREQLKLYKTGQRISYRDPYTILPQFGMFLLVKKNEQGIAGYFDFQIIFGDMIGWIKDLSNDHGVMFENVRPDDDER